MSEITPEAAALHGLRIRRRELELDAVAIKARIEEISDLIAMLEHGTRRKHRKMTVINMPDRVSGGIHEPDTEPAA